MSPDRVMVFVDYQNAHGWARRLFCGLQPHPADGHIDPFALGEAITRRRNRPSTLEGVRVYRGRPNPEHQAKAAAANDRQTDAWTLNSKVEVIRRNVYYPRDWPKESASEKGIDVALAVDLFRLAVERRYDVGVVFSSDTDLLPAIEAVKDSHLAHVEVAAWSGGHRLLIDGTKLPWCHFLNRDVFSQLKDPTDYTAP